MGGGDGRGMLEHILNEVENDATLSADSKGASEAGGGSSEAGEMGAFSLPPELMARLPSLLRAVQSLTEPPKGSDTPPHTPEALLCALRPYLSEPRRRALDTMVRIARLSESLGLPMK